MKIRQCPMCGNEFAPGHRSHTQKYCSKACQLRAAQSARKNPALGERLCETCSKPFRPKQMSSAGRFCSRPCLYAGTRREKAPNWRGGRWTNSYGYVKVYEPEHPSADSMGYVSEHRLVMERELGRPLARTETVHHLNGDRSDNRPENLQVRQGRHGKGVRYACLDCGSHNVQAVAI